MKNTIGKKILVAIFIPFLIIFGALSAYIAYTITVYVTNWTELEIKGISEINAADLEGRMYSVRVSVMAAADALEVLDTESDNPRLQADSIVRAMFGNRYIYNSWLAFEPNAFDGKDYAHGDDYPGAASGRFMRSYIMEGEQIIVAPDMNENTLDDEAMSPWYVIPRNTNRLYIDVDNELPNLYNYGIGSAPVYTLSVVAPVHKNGRVIGCVGADVLFDDMTFGIGGLEAAVAVFYPNGRVFYSQDLAFAEESIYTLGFADADQIMTTIKEGKSLFLPDEYSIFLGERAFTYFQHINISDVDSGSLYLYVATPRTAAYTTLRPVFMLIAAIFVVALAVISIMYLYVTSRISKPIRQLTLAADAISQGDFETEISSFIGAKDEIGIMSRSLHRMVEQFRVYILRQEQAQAEMTIHTKIAELIRDHDDTVAALNGLAAMLCRHIGVYKTTVISAFAGKAGIIACCEVDAKPREAEESLADFPYHEQVITMLNEKKILFLNNFTLVQQNVNFTDERTISACVVPLWARNTLYGYIIMENKEKNKTFTYGDEALLIYMAGMLGDWLSQRKTKEENMAGLIPTAMKIPASQAPLIVEQPSVLGFLQKVEGLEVDEAVAIMGGLEDVYAQSVRLLTRLIPEMVDKLDGQIAGDIHSFAVDIHGLKGSLNNVGAYALGRAAAVLEQAAKTADTAFCAENYPQFRGDLLEFYGNLQAALSAVGSPDKVPGSRETLAEALEQALAAASSYDALDALDYIRSLRGYTFGAELDVVLEDAAQALEAFDCESALSILSKLRGGIDA